MIRSQTLPSFTSTYIDAWDATHAFQQAAAAPPQTHTHPHPQSFAMQRSHSAANIFDKDSDASRYDKRRKMRYSSPPPEEIEHLQLQLVPPLPQPYNQTLSYPQPSLHPSVGLFFFLARQHTRILTRPSILFLLLSQLVQASNSSIRSNAQLPPRPLSAQPMFHAAAAAASANKRKADHLQIDIPHARSVSPAPPTFYSHKSLQQEDDDNDDEDAAEDDSAPSSPADAADDRQTTAAPAAHRPEAPTRRSSRHKADEDGFSSSTSEYNPDGTTPARASSASNNNTKRPQPHKQGKKKASKKAAALMSDPEYAVTSSVPPPRLVNNKKPDNGSKPSYSYAALIGQAILSSDHKLLSLNDIYCFIMVNYTYFKKDVAGWQNSIRHNLSLNPSFMKVARSAANPGKGSLWTVKPGDEELFANGGYIKRAAMQRTGSQTAPPPGGPSSPAASEPDAQSPEPSQPPSSSAAIDVASNPAPSRRPSSVVSAAPVEDVFRASKSATPELAHAPNSGLAPAQNVASSERDAEAETDSQAESDSEAPPPSAPLPRDVFQHVPQQQQQQQQSAPEDATLPPRHTGPLPVRRQSIEPSKTEGAGPPSHSALGAPVDLEGSSSLKRTFKAPQTAELADAEPEPTLSRPVEEEMSMHRRALFNSPAQRLRSPRRNSLSGIPTYDYAQLGSCTPGDNRFKTFGTPAQRSPAVFNSPAYYFSSEAYGDPNGKSHFSSFFGIRL